MNRLGNSSSDYLQQHAHQEVDWWPWGEAALAEAQERDVPILLSVGYASCHWCHVMSHESFDDAAIAQLINQHFVPIKVDRQQHPDVDAVYMTATQAMNGGAGGWPMTAFLTPTGEPFFTGTYFPPQSRHGMPSFRQVLEAMAEAWDAQRDEVVSSATAIAAQLREVSDVVPSNFPDVDAAVAVVHADVDPDHGGLGTAPKFPAATVVNALLATGRDSSRDVALASLEAMARGGIHDQIGGGFHRYSVDRAWVVPHFEKMLYDNALLITSYTRGWCAAAEDYPRRALFERTVQRAVEFLGREMRARGGGFISALDADSVDIRGMVAEGIFYAWTPELLTDALGERDGAWAAETFQVSAEGSFEDGLSVLQLHGWPDWDRLDEVSARLLAERANRFRPAADRLVVAGWNGLAISALVEAAMVFGQPKWLELAVAAARYVREVHVIDGVLRRSSLETVADAAEAMAEDYGAVAEGLARLAGATGDASWLALAEELLERAVEVFGAEDGGFFDGPESGLYQRPRTVTDQITPSGTSALVAALQVVGIMRDRADFVARAEAAASTTWGAVLSSPRFAGSALLGTVIRQQARKGLAPASVVVTDADPFNQLTQTAWRCAPAGSVVMTAAPDAPGWGTQLEGRSEPGAYVCRGTVCFEPAIDVAALREQLWRKVS